MPIETLVPAVVAAVVPYLAKGAEKLVDKSVDAGFEQRGKIWQLVKGLFVEDDLTLLNLEANPEDARTQGKLEAKLEDRLEAKPEVAAQLEELLKQIPASQIKQNTLTITGNNNVGLQDVTGSDIKINQK
ncbi:MAG TPA: hypothetical protein VF721_08175 [Pyrinomonadaceae bacterium]|jgi:hypothetical protein